MMRMGVQKNLRIICYDSNQMGMMGVARCYFVLKYFGAESVKILNGGLKKWKAEGRPVFEGPATEEPDQQQLDNDYSFAIAEPVPVIRDIAVMHDLVGKMYNNATAFEAEYQLVDARSKGRFEGTAPEPIEGLKSGHMKNSINLPFMTLLNADGTFKNKSELLAIYTEAGISPEKPTYNSCGTGMTACVNVLAQQIMGFKSIYMYDGSWAEYGSIEEPQF